MLLRALNWQNAWRIRMVALALITLLVGVGSQVLVNTFAAESPDINITVPSHISEENVAAANGIQFGTCTNAGVHHCTIEGNHHSSNAGHLHLSTQYESRPHL
jgi:hypothetical protein